MFRVNNDYQIAKLLITKSDGFWSICYESDEFYKEFKDKDIDVATNDALKWIAKIK